MSSNISFSSSANSKSRSLGSGGRSFWRLRLHCLFKLLIAGRLASGKSVFGFADRTVLTISDDLVNALVGSEACAFNYVEMVAATTWPGADGWLCGSLPDVNWSPIRVV